MPDHQDIVLAVTEQSINAAILGYLSKLTQPFFTFFYFSYEHGNATLIDYDKLKQLANKQPLPTLKRPHQSPSLHERIDP